MNPPTLTACHHGPLLILFWNQATALPRDFRLVLNKSITVPKPYLGIVLGVERNQALCIAQADEAALSDKVSVTLIGAGTEEGVRLAATRKARLSVFCKLHLQDLPLTDRQRISKGLVKGLRTAFPTVEAQWIDQLLEIVALNDVANPAPPTLPAHLPAANAAVPLLQRGTGGILPTEMSAIHSGILYRLDGRHVLGWLLMPDGQDRWMMRVRHMETGAVGVLRRMIRLGRPDQDGALALFEFTEALAETAALQLEYRVENQWRSAQPLIVETDLVRGLMTLGDPMELALPLWELARDFNIPLPVPLAVWLEPGRRKAIAQLQRVVRHGGEHPGQVFTLDIEHCGGLPGAGLFLSGYQIAAPGKMRRLVLHLPTGSHDLSDQLTRTVRRDLVQKYRWAGDPVADRPGLECVVLTDQKLATLETGYLAVELDDATVARVALRPVIDLSASRDILEVRQALRLLEGFGPLLAGRSRRALQPLLMVAGDWLRQTQTGLKIQPGRTGADGLQLYFDQVLALSDQSLYLGGWLADLQRHVVEIRLFTALGDTVDLTGQIPNSARPDIRLALQQQGLTPVNEYVGFHLRLDLPLPLGADTPVYLRVQLRDGGIHRMSLKLRRCDLDRPLPLIRELLGSFPTWEPRLFDFYDRAVGPAIAQLWAGRAHPTLDVQQETFGVIPPAPQVSIIVPLYGRIDLLSFQLAQFANDPDFQSCELIYVLDDPALYHEFVALCRREYPLFRVPFRTVISGANLGYAGATNLGAAQAHGEYLLLLNSDVFPRQPGWLSRMVERFEGMERPGVLGPKLLFPDGLIQHAGMTFFQEPTLPGFWFNDHPDKGLPNHSTADGELSEVVAVTGACMLLRRAVYQEVGGLSEDYILGDFEDSDLCLKLRAAGYRIGYTPQVELYHLERLSFPHAGDAGWRTNLSRYNAWVQTKRWGEVIQGLSDNAATL